MPGAGKKRAKAGHKKPETEHAESHASAYPPPAVYDGPASRPGSSAAGGSRGRAPSNAPPGGQFGEQSIRSSSQAPTATQGPLRDLARDPDKDQPPINHRVEWGGNAFNYFSTDEVSNIFASMCLPFVLRPRTSDYESQVLSLILSPLFIFLNTLFILRFILLIVFTPSHLFNTSRYPLFQSHFPQMPIYCIFCAVDSSFLLYPSSYSSASTSRPSAVWSSRLYTSLHKA